jgi:hypothetical protein
VGTGSGIFVSACDDSTGTDSGIYISSALASGDTCSNLSCSSRSSDVGNTCAANTDSSMTMFDTVAGLTYYVQVFSHGAEPTSGQLRVVNA